MSQVNDHNRSMLQALRLAGRGQGRVEPNPMVGCVVADSGKVVAEGWHRRFGGPHAEIDALRQARDRRVDVSRCDLYVNLEPCCHQGKTPPCTEALIAARPARVYVAMVDPNPLVAGQGIERLRQAGIHVEVGLCERQAGELNEPFVKRIQTGLPWVIAKWAQTLDGRIATRSGDSKWISNEASRRWVHRLRARVDAVVVGIGTIEADNARLTAREMPRRREARRVVVDPDLRIAEDAAVLGEGPATTIAVKQQLLDQPSAKLTKLRDCGVEIIGLPPADDDPRRLALAHLLHHLAQAHQATNVLVEGGAGLLSALLRQKLVDQVVAFVAPKLIGDDQALPPLRGLTIERIADATTLTLRQCKLIEQDVMLDYRVASAAGP